MGWDFLQRYDESWIWRHTHRHQVTESTRNFAALDECIADAVHHGYVAADARRHGRSRPIGRGQRIPKARGTAPTS